MNSQLNTLAQGRQCDFLQFLQNYTKVVIPIIQRDYAQGRKPEISGPNKPEVVKQHTRTSFYEEVRENFVESLKVALTEDKTIVLDYIYGSVPTAGDDKIFYPIDGQQRLTTLFLLYWYVASKENKLDDQIRNELKKFSYETRDTSQEFCAALTEMRIDVASLSNQEALSTAIRNSSSYYNVYDFDPTVCSMLVMLDALHHALSSFNGLWGKLSNITFWELDLQNFGLTDDLFVKMNARGKRLSRFDMFKSDLESALKRAAISAGKADIDGSAKMWVTEIDNDYLDNFWEFDNIYCERNMFRLCMFLSGCFALIKDNSALSAAYDETWIFNDTEVSYREQINEIANNSELLTALCRAFYTFPKWSEKDDGIKSLLITSVSLNKSYTNWTHYSRVRMFAVIYWYIKIEDARRDDDFNAFMRIINNYIYGFREYSIRDGQFASSISNATIAPRLKFIKQLIDDFSDSKDSFNDFILKASYRELSFECEKLKYPHFEEIESLEKLNCLGRNIQNFFYDQRVYVSADDLNTIISDDQLCHRMLCIILSYTGNRNYGKITSLLFDRSSSQTRRKLIAVQDDRGMGYYHTFSVSKDAEFGDKILSAHKTSSPEICDLHDAVIKFAEAFAKSTEKTVEGKLKSIYEARLKTLQFPKDDILDYFVKHDEFYFENGFYILARRHLDRSNTYFTDDAYDIYCTDRGRNLDRGYYQPFYLAIANKLNEKFIKYTGNTIKEEGYLLSNGWRLIIQPQCNFLIKFNGKPPKSYVGQEELFFETKGDCIESVCNFIKEIRTN